MFRKLVLFLTITIAIQTISVEALKCLVCDSDADANCISDLSKVTAKDCTTEEQFCSTSIDASGKVTRACAKEECDTDICKSAKTDSSNKHNICQACTSSSNAACAQSETVVKTFNKLCAAEKTKCLVKIKDKNTERGCATADDEKTCTDANVCKACEGGNCNSGVFPTNRLRCYQCKDSDSKCTNVYANSDTIKSLPCLLYDSADKCYTYGTEATKMNRGCVSDSTENKCSTPASSDLCATCDKAHCNDQTYLRDQTLRCLQCTSSTTDQKCKWGQEAQEANNCKNQIPYNKVEMCYTQTVGEIVHRGCFHDREDGAGECKSETSCETCTQSDGNGCNNKDKADFSCIVCRSDEKKDCFNNADKITGAACRNAVKYEKRGCFHWRANNNVIRGCLVDADERVEAECRNNNTMTCRSCLDKNCNVWKSSATSNSYTIATLLLLGIVLLVQNF